MSQQQRGPARPLAPTGTVPVHDSIDVDAALSSAANHLREGRLGDAEVLARQILETSPDHPEALHVLGMIAVRAGYTTDAITLFQRCVTLDGSDPLHHANLGAALEDDGRLDDAASAYRRATDLQPEFADMHYRLGNVCVELGRLDQAVAAYEQTVALRPDYAEAHYNLGNARMQCGLTSAAVTSYQRCIELIPGFAQGHCNLGNAYNSLARHADAVACYQRALEIDSEFALAWSNLANSLGELGRHDEALQACERAIAAQPDYARAHSNRGVILKTLGRLDQAVEAYRNAIGADSRLVDAHFNLGNVLRLLERTDEAVAAYRLVLELSPDHAFACSNIGTILVERGDAGSALQVCDRFLETSPGDTGVLACSALALDELGRRQEVRALVDFDRLVMAKDFDAPAGFTGMDAFNEALQRHILEHPTLMEDPSTHATRFGKHTGNLLVEPKGPIAAYELMIHQAVREYMASHPIDPSHPFLANRPSSYRLDVWAVVMRAQGHQIAHIHPSSWLSGVYYPKLPPVVQAQGEDRAGWIEFGEPGAGWRYSVTPEVEIYQPAEGRMFLFPSYFWHRTIPFETNDLRISIAFDVIPKRSELCSLPINHRTV